MRRKSRHYDKEHDILYVTWKLGGQDVDYSEEMKTMEGHQFVVDYSKKGQIIGIEIFDWKGGREAIKKRIIREIR